MIDTPRERYEQNCEAAGAALEAREQRHMREVGPVCRPLRATYLTAQLAADEAEDTRTEARTRSPRRGNFHE